MDHRLDRSDDENSISSEKPRTDFHHETETTKRVRGRRKGHSGWREELPTSNLKAARKDLRVFPIVGAGGSELETRRERGSVFSEGCSYHVRDLLTLPHKNAKPFVHSVTFVLGICEITVTFFTLE